MPIPREKPDRLRGAGKGPVSVAGPPARACPLELADRLRQRRPPGEIEGKGTDVLVATCIGPTPKVNFAAALSGTSARKRSARTAAQRRWIGL